MKLVFILSLILITGCASEKSHKNQFYNLKAGTCQNGTTRTGYKAPSVLGDFKCETTIQNCINANWQGPMLYESCVEQFKSCNGIPHGTVETGYQSSTSPKDIPCIHAARTCLNGSWSGPEVYTSCSELP